jgi:dTDP-4-dehydrorhamnose 3,5-epimerase
LLNPYYSLVAAALNLSVRRTALEGVVVIEPPVHRDARGFFLESYHRRHYVEHGIPDEFVQDNLSHSLQAVLRGIHYQDMTAPMSKLVRCAAGSVLDIVVDLRLGSATFGRWVGETLSGDNLRQVFIPVGFGHAFLTLSPSAEVEYKCGGYYAPAAEGSVAWNDPEIGIRWPIEAPLLSDKDRQAPSLAEYAKHPAFRAKA